MALRPKLDDALRRVLADVLSAFPEILVAYVFGSVIRGEADESSDLDIGVVLRRGAELEGIRAALLAAEVSRKTAYERVDVVDLVAQGPIFAHGVLCSGELVHEADPDRRVDFESETCSRAFDFRPTYEIATADKAAAMRKWLEERYDL